MIGGVIVSIYQQLFSMPKEFEKKQIITGLVDETCAIFTTQYFYSQDRGIVFVAQNTYEANQMYNRLVSYLPKDSVLLFLMDDFFTSEALAASPELKAMRLQTLNQLALDGKKVVVTDLMGFLKFLPSKVHWDNRVIDVKLHDEISMETLRTRLVDNGYTIDSLVQKTGELGVRGFILDVFPIDEEQPVRIEFFGDFVESIRYFDVETQLTTKRVDQLKIYPFTDSFADDNSVVMEENLLNYVEKPIIFYKNYNQIEKAYQALLKQIKEYKNETPFHYIHDLNSYGKVDQACLYTVDNYFSDEASVISYDCREVVLPDIDFSKIKSVLIDLCQSKTTILCVSDLKKLKRFQDILPTYVITNENEILNGQFNVIQKDVQGSFAFDQYVFLSDALFFQKETKKRYRSNFKYGTKIKDLSKLEVGDYVVHNAHGVGVYAGLVMLTKKGIKKDYLQINYQDDGKLYIPVEKIHLITKFSQGTAVGVKVNKLGGSDWQKKKLHIKKRIQEIASQLLFLSAKRELQAGFACQKDTPEQAMFDSEFEYEETKDQLLAIQQIKQDMEKSSPMDRLLCGDVGFGKTEVAFRAMFKAVDNGKQVAYLCPTTILSTQHYENAVQRFANFPIRIGILNRFNTPKETQSVLTGLKDGTIDIVIGTHRLLSKDVQFKDLGLLVVDEEQRFGVLHKEKIKEIKANVDVLTLSATPIPRTMQMSMVGLRNISLIETPPVNRFPVQTYVLEENKNIIKDAIYKELNRQGQVFILYNKVSNMEGKLQELKQLVPEARIIYAHGQMTKAELENRMLDFIEKRYDILLCTTIIETGIDIPNANTLIIMDADHFGLAQLYQIRGRVGRSEKTAYAYLMYRRDKILSENSKKRLEVIKQFTELGSGFRIAMRDLSIRGGGNILGSEQAGFIDTIGIELYNKILNDEMNRIKGNPIDLEDEIEINEAPLVDVETHIDDTYVMDTDLKIEIHNKINEVNSYESLLKIKEELEDRFGKISDSLLIYMYEEWFEKLSREVGVERVQERRNFIEIVLSVAVSKKIDGQSLFMEASDISRMFRLQYKLNRIVIIIDTIKLEKHWLYYVVELLNRRENYLKEE